MTVRAISWEPTHIIVREKDGKVETIPVQRSDAHYPTLAYTYHEPMFTSPVPTRWTQHTDGRWREYGELVSCVVYKVEPTKQVLEQIVIRES